MRRRAAGACLPALPAVWRHNHYGGVWRPWRNLNRSVGLRRFHGALTPDWAAPGVGTRAMAGAAISTDMVKGDAVAFESAGRDERIFIRATAWPEPVRAARRSGA